MVTATRETPIVYINTTLYAQVRCTGNGRTQGRKCDKLLGEFKKGTEGKIRCACGHDNNIKV